MKLKLSSFLWRPVLGVPSLGPGCPFGNRAPALLRQGLSEESALPGLPCDRNTVSTSAEAI